MLNQHETMHLHEYSRIYAVPGLYEYVVQERLRCRSPQVAVEGFLRAVADLALAPDALTVLDFGAGTGLVGELLRSAGITEVVGVDALPAARMAGTRDRPGVYADYLVGDFAHDDALRSYSFGGLVSAGAFGGTTIERLTAGGDLVVMERSRFQHRVTTAGEPIFYQLVVARTGCG